MEEVLQGGDVGRCAKRLSQKGTFIVRLSIIGSKVMTKGVRKRCDRERQVDGSSAEPPLCSLETFLRPPDFAILPVSVGRYLKE